MKKVLQPLFLTVLAVPSFVFAAETASAPQTTTVDKVLAAKGPTSAQAVVKQENTTVISPGRRARRGQGWGWWGRRLLLVRQQLQRIM